MEPIANLLSGTKLSMAMLQDTLIDLIYDTIQADATLYGGTAVWRCYNGNRFSEEIDNDNSFCPMPYSRNKG